MLVGLVLVGVLAFLAGARIDDRFSLFPEATRYEEIGPEVVQSVRELSELTTLEMVQYTTVEKGEDRGWLDWARGDRIYMLAVARIGAGVDLARLESDDFSVDEESGRVTVRLPQPKILYVALDNEATHVYDRDTGIFTKGNPKLETAARQVAEEVLLQGALDADILVMANESAAKAITNFLEGLGYQEVRIVTTDPA